MHRENREELRFEAKKNGERDIRFRRFEKLEGPAEFDEHRAGRREQNEIIPALAQGDGGDANIQDRDVAEERGRIIDPGRKQNGREKSAEQTEDHDDLGVHADSQEKRRARHDRHGSERGNEFDQVVENVGRKNISVENQDAGRAEALAGDAVAPGRRQPAGHDEGEPDDRAYHHPHGRSDEIVLEGVLHEKNDPEEKDEAADPREKFDPKKCFPIDRGPRRARWRWRLYRRRLANRLPGQRRFWNWRPRWQRRQKWSAVQRDVWSTWDGWRSRAAKDGRRRDRRCRNATAARFQFPETTTELAHGLLEFVQLHRANHDQGDRAPTDTANPRQT